MSKSIHVDPSVVKELEAKAIEVRTNIIEMIYEAQSGHPGGSLSATDIVTALYFYVMNVDPKNPSWKERDRFVLSKGHACPVWYAALALKGYFPMSELKTLRKFETHLQGHPVQGKCPGVDATTGSLGVGFSQALGMALEAKMTGKSYRVYAVLGDGETNEGIVWETAAAAAKFKLANFVAIVDRNGLQNDGYTKDIMPMDPIDKKFESFGWDVVKINGHIMSDVVNALVTIRENQTRPTVIVADTVKGRGVSFMENVRGWHGKAPNKEQLDQALAEIKGGLK